jgi:hypothetical protein
LAAGRRNGFDERHTPVLQALVRIAFRVLFGLFLLGEMTLVVSGHLPHVSDIIVVVFGWVFFRVLPQNLDDLPSTIWEVRNCTEYVK